MAKYTTEQLETGTLFRQVHSLSYDDILGFVWTNIRVKNAATQFFLFINVLYFVFLTGISLTGIFIHGFHTGKVLACILWGILAGSFVVIPFHEGFHGLAYLLIGARRIRFGMDLKQMLFYVAADRYVTSRRQFYFIALAPFTAINILAIALAFYFTGYWPVFIFTFLLFHNIMCVGDFAMISFFLRFPRKELYTFDDHKRRISYIYEKIESPG